MSPMALDPGAEFYIVLSSDRAKLNPPTFVFRHLPVSGFRKLAEQADHLEEMQADPSIGAGEMLDHLLGLVRLSLVRWDRMIRPDGIAIEYDPDRLGDLVTLPELHELLVRIRDEMALGDDAKKGSGSPSASGTASSAPAATPSSAEAISRDEASGMSSPAPPAAAEAEDVPNAGTECGS